jgi:hypothetical protein
MGDDPAPKWRPSVWLGFVALALLGLIGFPLFLRMPLGNDVVHYDLCARTVLGGGAMYQDLFDTNLPAIVWLHLLIRSLAGWSSEAMRLADLEHWLAGTAIGVCFALA